MGRLLTTEWLGGIGQTIDFSMSLSAFQQQSCQIILLVVLYCPSQFVSAVIVVAGKDETSLCNLFEIANRCWEHCWELTHPLSSRKYSLTRTLLRSELAKSWLCVPRRCRWFMRCGAVLQRSTRRCVLEEKASVRTPSLSSWKVRQQHACVCLRQFARVLT